MPQKEKPEYSGRPNTDIYVVWVDGAWRMYASITQANVRYMRALREGKPAQLIRYEMSEIIGEFGIVR